MDRIFEGCRNGRSDGEEVDAGTDPLDADQDGDGVTDGEDSDPTSGGSDSDGDGISDADETAAGLDPTNADSDGDGTDDGDDHFPDDDSRDELDNPEATFSPKKRNRTVIQWEGVYGATGYRVVVNGETVCEKGSAARKCVVRQALGSDADVQILALNNYGVSTGESAGSVGCFSADRVGNGDVQTEQLEVY